MLTSHAAAGTPSDVSGALARLEDLGACFHCGQRLPGIGVRQLELLGRTRSFCCSGCEAVAATISASGFERFYTVRDHSGAMASSAEAPLADPLQRPSAEVFDDPQSQREFVTESDDDRLEASLILEGMRCGACAWLNEQRLRQLPGVSEVSVNYTTRRMRVVWLKDRIRLSTIVEAIHALGYQAHPHEASTEARALLTEKRQSLWRVFVAGFGSMQVMMYAAPRYLDDFGVLSAETEQLMRWASLALTLPVVVFCCTPFFAGALADLRRGRLGMDVPVALGILTGLLASLNATLRGSGEVYFDSITMLVFLLLGARHVELMARQRACAGLDRLHRWRPDFAMRVPAGGGPAVRVHASELRAADRVVVSPGEAFPADGCVLQGEGHADESLLTGESAPVFKRAGVAVIGGTINIDQPLQVSITRTGRDTRAAGIARLIEKAANDKPHIIHIADRVAAPLTWVVLAASLVAFAAWSVVEPSRALWVAVAVLVATCPCALALAAPIALTGLVSKLAQRGIVLIRSGAIERLDEVTDVILDKTGTLTEGRMRLVHVHAFADLDREACLTLAAVLESGSRHPIAVALAAGAARPNPEQGAVEFCDISSHAGAGVEGRRDNRVMRLGTAEFVGAISGPRNRFPPVSVTHTPVFLGESGRWIARFDLEDQPRAGAATMVKQLQAHGLRVHLLSGDHANVVAHHAGMFGLQSWTAAAKPEDKCAFLAELQAQGRKVVMIGDGANDAPVLAQANVSIAMGSGAPLAQLQADCVMLSGDLNGVSALLEEARRTMRIIRQNFGWALAYNAIALPLAMIGWIGPWEAAIGMAGSSLVVVLNALRVLQKRTPGLSGAG